MISLRAVAFSASLAAAAIVVTGCGAGSHGSQSAGSPGAAHSSPAASAGSTPVTAPTVTAVAAPTATGTDQNSQIAAVESDLSGATAASSQAQTDVDAAASAQAVNDGP